jgi:hypothetical protein
MKQMEKVFAWHEILANFHKTICFLEYFLLLYILYFRQNLCENIIFMSTENTVRWFLAKMEMLEQFSLIFREINFFRNNLIPKKYKNSFSFQP